MSRDDGPSSATALIRRLAAALLRLVSSLALVLALLAIWQWRAVSGALNSGTLPSPASVIGALGDLATSGDLARHSIASAQRVLLGFALASALAFGLAVLVARFPLAFRPIRTFVDVLRPIPPLAWIPLAILWFGIGGNGPIFIVALGAFFPTAVAMLDAVYRTETHFVDVARTLGSSPSMVALRVVVPAAMPRMVTGLRVGLGVAWTSVIAAELVAGQDGLGYLLNSNRLLLRSDIVVASMVMIGIIGLFLIWMFHLIESALLRRWTGDPDPFAGRGR